MKENKSFNYIYKITNTINNKIYTGVHHTNNLDDGYMGSGKKLHRAFKKYGIEHFKKEILEYFNTWDEALKKEAEIVNEEFVKREDTYNMTCGGGSFYHTKGTVMIKIEDGTSKRIQREEFYKNKDKYKTHSFGKVTCIDENGKYVQVSKEEYLKNRDKYKTSLQSSVIIINDGFSRIISCEEYQKNRDKYRTACSNKITVKDSEGNTFMVDKNDPRYISGELTAFWKGKKHSEESKRKMRKSKKGFGIGDKNSQYNTCWIHNDELKQNKKIKKEDLEKYISEGWIKGRLCKYNKNYIPPKPPKCKICGQNRHAKNGICESQYLRFTTNIEKLGFDVSKIGSKEVFDEYNKLKCKLHDLYYVQNYSLPIIKKMFDMTSENVVRGLIFWVGLKTRNISESLKVFYKNERSYLLTGQEADLSSR